jgi:predicted nucleic acid-binding protein
VKVGYVDTSCLVAVAFAERGFEDVIARLDGLDRLVSSNLLEAELRAVLHREGVDDDEAILARITWVLPDRSLRPEIDAVVTAGRLRGADLWHVACALYLSPQPGELEFVTMDQRQASVAAVLGFAGMEPTDRPT